MDAITRRAPPTTCRPLIQATASRSPPEGVAPPPIFMASPLGLLAMSHAFTVRRGPGSRIPNRGKTMATKMGTSSQASSK